MKSRIEQKAEKYRDSLSALEKKELEINISLYHALSEETFDEKIQELENSIVIDMTKPGAKEKMKQVLEILEELKP